MGLAARGVSGCEGSRFGDINGNKKIDQAKMKNTTADMSHIRPRRLMVSISFAATILCAFLVGRITG